MALAMLITIFGFLMLFNRMGILPSELWGYFWPLVVVAVGLSMMHNKMNHHGYFCDCWGEKHHSKKGSGSHRK